MDYKKENTPLYVKKNSGKILWEIGVFIIKDIMKFTITEEEKKSIRGMYLLEQETSGTTPNTQYMAAGTKFCFFGSCRIDIKVIDKTTSQIITSKGSEGTDVNSLYPQVIKLIQDELTTKKITGVTLPTLEQLEDTSPKK
jgi:hypothetical protein